MCYKAFNFHTWEQREEKGWADAGPGKPRPLGGGGVGVCGLCRGQNERGSGRGPKEANWGSEQEARKGCCYSQQFTALKQAGPWACLDLNTSHPNHAGTTREASPPTVSLTLLCAKLRGEQDSQDTTRPQRDQDISQPRQDLPVLAKLRQGTRCRPGLTPPPNIP